MMWRNPSQAWAEEEPGMAPPPPPECFAEDYDSLGRFASYWHQIEEILALRPASVLEIGTGNGLVSSYLRQRDIALTVLDIDGRVQSDVIGSVTRLPIRDAAFDVVSCCQVLEHLPYEEFAVALGEIFRFRILRVFTSFLYSSRKLANCACCCGFPACGRPGGNTTASTTGA
jgi:SAM-dependent methyltransferase